MTTEYTSTKIPSNENPDRRQEDRRLYPRLPILQGIPLKAVMETSDHILRDVRCVNLGSRGALFDFGDGKCPNLALNSKIRVALQLGSDTVNIPAEIRHRTNDSVGVLFPFGCEPELEKEEQALSLILRTLERALARRGSIATTRIITMDTIQTRDEPTPAPAAIKETQTRVMATPATGTMKETRLADEPEPETEIATDTVVPPTDRRQQERRKLHRVPVLNGIPMKAQCVGPDKILREVRCVNLGSRGALLDFGDGKCPNLAQNSKISLILQLGSDTASIPAAVRHRTPDRIGVFFPFDSDGQRKEQEQALSLILRTLERAVARRKGTALVL